jgi:hypothetical protein
MTTLKNHIPMKPVQHLLDEHRRRLAAADPRRQCDCCGQLKLVERCWTSTGIETFACSDCRGDFDER